MSDVIALLQHSLVSGHVTVDTAEVIIIREGVQMHEDFNLVTFIQETQCKLQTQESHNLYSMSSFRCFKVQNGVSVISSASARLI